jgi:hypothetical protein
MRRRFSQLEKRRCVAVSTGGVHPVGRRIDAENLPLLDTVHVYLAVAVGDRVLQPAAYAHRRDHAILLRIDDREQARIAIDHEDMSARRVDGDCVRIRRRGQSSHHFQGLQTECDGFSSATIIGVPEAGCMGDRDPVCAPGHARDLTDDPAVMAIHDRQAIAVGDVDAVRWRIIDDIVPAVGRPERYRAHQAITNRGRGSRRRRLPKHDVRQAQTNSHGKHRQQMSSHASSR